MRILITGGAGFIGSHLVEFHLKRGDEVFVVDNLSTGLDENIEPFRDNPNFHFEKADLLIWKNLSTQLLWADRVYHLAAMVGMYNLLANPVETLTSNIFGCERLLRVMHECKSQARLIVASTSEVYGPSNKEKLCENDLLLFKSASHSKWGYATSKFTEEMLSLAYAYIKKINVTVVRLFNTIGPRQRGHYGMVVPRFVGQAVHHDPITVYGDGEQTRSFCDVRDVVVALERIADTPALIGEIINLGQDREITINALASMIKQLANSDSVIQHIGYKEAYGQDYEDILNRRPDLTKFNQFIDYQFQWDLEKTLLNLINMNCNSF